MNLYPSPNTKVTFEQMEKAALAAINKDPTYPEEGFGGLDSLAFAVYSNRVFAFRIFKLIYKKKGLLGGAISRLGLFLQYHDKAMSYPWMKITNLDITKTFETVENISTTTQTTYYDISLRFADGTGFVLNCKAPRFKEFPKRTDNSHWKRVADLFALYYNRVRQERMQKVIHNGTKKVWLHKDVEDRFAKEILRRFNSPKGVLLKYFRKRAIISREGIKFFKSKRKMTSELKWTDFNHLIIGLGALSPVILFLDSKNPSNYVESFYPNNYNLKPKDKSFSKDQKMHIVPICWLNL